MEQFLQALGSPGVAPFTVLLVAALLYWVMVILGALDIDILHLGHHGSHHEVGDVGAHGQAGHSGHASHSGHDAADGQHGHAADGHHGGGFMHLVRDLLALGKVPVTVTASLLVASGWIAAMGLVLVLGLPWPLVLLGALVVAFPVTAMVNRPLRAAFGALNGGVLTGVSLLGREARITSVTCTSEFGTATCEVDRAEVLLRVITIRPELVFKRDDVVVIADHDGERDHYLVAAAGYRHEPAPALTAAAPPAPPADGSSPLADGSSPLVEPAAPPAAGQVAPVRARPTVGQ